MQINRLQIVKINAGNWNATAIELSTEGFEVLVPSLASAYSIRVEEYRPELPALSTAVKMIALMKLAARQNQSHQIRV